MSKAETERVPFNLPLKEKTGEIDVTKYCSAVKALLKKQIVHVINNDSIAFDEELEKILTQLASDSYSNGLAHMDKMHALTNK